jgi:hypothetical protein
MVRAEILTLLNELMGAYPYVPIKDPETTARMYELSLGEYEAKHVFMAARIHIRNNKYFPSPNHLIELIPKGKMLCEMEEEKAKALTAPKQEMLPAPDKRIAIKQDCRCPLHEGECVMMYGELCDGPEDGKCPFEGL